MEREPRPIVRRFSTARSAAPPPDFTRRRRRQAPPLMRHVSKLRGPLAQRDQGSWTPSLGSSPWEALRASIWLGLTIEEAAKRSTSSIFTRK